MRHIALLLIMLIAIPQASAADLTHIDGAQLAAARAWLRSQSLDAERMSRMSEADRAKAALFATYRFCEAGNATPADLNDLYKSCSTQCGGFAYFYRGVAGALGLKSRYLRIYNIPNQGNHVAVEVSIGGKWRFFDPTFGTFFTGDGSYGGKVLPFHEIATGMPPEALAGHVEQADRSLPVIAAIRPGGDFGAVYDHPYMPITNYQVAEAVTTDDPAALLALRVGIRPGETLGDFAASDRKALSAGWLAYTNATLNDDAPMNDVSYNAAQLFNTGPQKLTIVRMTGLKPGTPMTLELRSLSGGRAGDLEVTSPGKEIRLMQESTVAVPEGVSTVRIPFVAHARAGEMLLRNLAPAGRIELFAFRLK